MPQQTNNKELDKPTDDRMDTLVNLILHNKDKTPIKQLALQAGYSASYADSYLYKVMQNRTFKQKLIGMAKSQELEALPDILGIRKQAIDEYKNNPALVIEKPKLYETFRKDLELSKPEETTGNTYIAINTLQQLVATGNQAQDIQEAKVIDED